MEEGAIFGGQCIDCELAAVESVSRGRKRCCVWYADLQRKDDGLRSSVAKDP